MPPFIALILTIFLILFLLHLDKKNSIAVSKSIWIPFIWIFLASSRYTSQWLSLSSSGSVTDGSPVDRAVFMILMFLGILTLQKRNINWHKFFGKYLWIWLYFMLGLASLLWSDYPFIAFKRIIKSTGNVIMVLIILTEMNPYLSFGFIIRRISLILLPLSVLFIKYYPHLGRSFAPHSGIPLYSGVATQKNGLGALCLISAIYYSWNLIFGGNGKHPSSQNIHKYIYIIILPMIAWLLNMANSATSFGCLIIALAIFFTAKYPTFTKNPQAIVTISIIAIAVFGITEYLFEIKNTIILLLGRKPDLTTRVPMWEDLLSMVKNPFLGYGFESFWLGERRMYMYNNWGISHSAHNGYIEMYMQMGYIGVFVLVMWFLTGFKNILHHLQFDYPTGILRFCILIIIVIYNYTEATVTGVSMMWTMLFFAIISPLNDHYFKEIESKDNLSDN